MIRVPEIKLPLDSTEEDLLFYTAKQMKTDVKEIQSIQLVKRSIDARNKQNIHFICTVDVALSHESVFIKHNKNSKIKYVAPYEYTIPATKKMETRPIVVGFGPAGMFAALILAQAGQNPIVIERGSAVEKRQEQVFSFWYGEKLNPESNVQFGEGGAGTFSDGKLNTGTKDGRARKVLLELAEAGAPSEILYLAHPHIGTDYLPNTVRNIRKKIISLGGEIHFDTKLKNITEKSGSISSIEIQSQNGASTILETNHLILAIGHSARDTYEMLYNSNLVHIEQKPFSIGARIEHPQSLINRTQFGPYEKHPALGAAEYKQAVHLKNGRGVYTFCMCPGGIVVASASEEGGVVTNGMSNFARNGKNANAALLVGVGPSDFGDVHPLAGMYLQRKLEQRAFELGGKTYAAPVQRVEDFIEHRASTRLGDVIPTYQRGVVPCDLSSCFHEEIYESLREGILKINHNMNGFSYGDALLTAVETRSSAPIRILRDETLQSVTLKGLYPCGEGAGYAGGIVSAAVDGIKCAEQILYSALQ